MTNSSIYIAGIALAVFARGALNWGPSRYEAVESHMGALFRIELYAADLDQAQRAFRASFNRVSELDDILSDYKPESELNRVCRAGAHRQMEVSSDLYRVISASQQLSEESGGAFDITVGPLTHLWRAARKINQLPDKTAIEEAKGRCGFRKLHINPVGHTVEFDQDGMQLDLGGIAKGYAADEVLVVLSKLGIRSALVAASGDLAFSDAPPGATGWKIGIDSYDRAAAPFTHVLLLANGAVSTSGDSEQHLDADGVRYSHIVDPKTGIGLTRPITVTIVARHGIDSDGISTAVSVLGAIDGLKFVDRHSGLAALIISGGRDQPLVSESSRFQLLPKAQPDLARLPL